MADKSKNFGNKVANFGKKFIGGLLFDDLPEASQTSIPDRYEYPLHDTQDYKSCVEFSVLEEEQVNLSELIGLTSIFGSNESLEEGEDDTENTEEQKFSSRKFFKETIENMKSTANAESTEGKDDAVQTQKGKSTDLFKHNYGKKVKLYLPAAVPFRDTASYDNADLGMAGGIVEAGGAAGQNLIAGLAEGVGRTLGSAFTQGAGSQVGRLALTKLSISKYLGGEGSQLAVRQAAGVSTNPNTRSLFKSVALREFAFQFKFLPLSEQEHDHVISIINFFRTELYPEDITVDVGDAKASVGFRFPNRFGIKILYNDVENPNTPRILPCYLRDVTTTYNPSNQAMHADGRFSEIDMSLAFTETRTLSKRDLIGDKDTAGGY